MYSSWIEEGNLQPPPADSRCYFGATGYPYGLSTQLTGGDYLHIGQALPSLLDQGDHSGPVSFIGRATMASEQSTVAGTRSRKAPKRKPGTKDRHSKIPTAKGMRDRRMRLSLDVARKFFRLQDLLGYDKASKTVKWLMDNARPAIKQLTRSTRSNQPEYSSECVFFPNSDDAGETGNKKLRLAGGAEESATQTEKGKTGSLIRRAVSLPTAKESRDKARARARERTKEKNMKRRLAEAEESGIKPNRSSLSHEHKSSPPAPAKDPAEHSSRSQEQNPSASIGEMNIIEHDSISRIFDIPNCFLPRMNSTFSGSTVPSHNNEGGGIFGPDNSPIFWDSSDANMNSSAMFPTNIHSPAQFTDLQFALRPWEFPFHI